MIFKLKKIIWASPRPSNYFYNINISKAELTPLLQSQAPNIFHFTLMYKMRNLLKQKIREILLNRIKLLFSYSFSFFHIFVASAAGAEENLFDPVEYQKAATKFVCIRYGMEFMEKRDFLTVFPAFLLTFYFTFCECALCLLMEK